jgi:hypothetical protein
MAIDLFDPTTSTEKTPIDYVPRPRDLKGLRVGLVDNSKFNSKILLLKIADRLQVRYGVEMTHLVTKASAGHAVSEAAVKAFKGNSDFVVAGIGD